ncbi:MAG TPA: PAS domain S-box protein [Burkholderiales bacterium]|nr:PAS domain S-box protein [Burkholderiales bacterium]
MDMRRSVPPQLLSIENAMDGIHVVDVDGNVVAVNAAFCDMLGYSREELLSMNVRDWDAQWNSKEIEAKISEILKRREVFETRFRRKDGTVIEAEVSVAASAVDGQTMLFASARDITLRKRAEAELLESEERFRCMVEQSIAGVYVVQDGRICYVNSRLAEIFRYPSPDDIVGRPYELLVAPEDRELVASMMARRFGGGSRRERYTFRALARDGARIDVGADGALSTYRDRPAIVGLLQDISERRDAENQINNYVAKLESALRGTVQVASTMSEMRDPYTSGHERKVGEIAAAIGGELGLEEHRLEGLRVIGLLHDIGKISVPAEILAKPGRLSEIEFELIKEHPRRGYDILKNVDFPWPLAQTVHQHHERLDGSGYPQGLKGEQVILEARILAVADTIEAMSSHRPYREALGLERALAVVESGRETKFDAAVVDACLMLYRQKALALPR